MTQSAFHIILARWSTFSLESASEATKLAMLEQATKDIEDLLNEVTSYKEVLQEIESTATEALGTNRDRAARIVAITRTALQK